MQENPLLEEGLLPDFAAIRPEHVEPAIDTRLAACRDGLEQLLAAAQGHYTWDNLVAPLEALNDALEHSWAPVRHLNSVMGGGELREVYNRCRERISDYWSALGQHAGLCAAYQALRNGPEYARLEKAQRRTVENALRDFRLSGIDLPPEQQAEFRDYEQRLSRLTAQFSDNLLDATDNGQVWVEAEAQLAGIPEGHKARFAQAASEAGREGAWRIGLDGPSYIAVLTYADDRALREAFYAAYVTRASDQGPDAGRWDNSAVMEEILAVRHAQARLLGFNDYAELSLATKMAERPEQVIDFLLDLARRSRPLAEQDLAAVTAYARAQDGLTTLEAWDQPYYSEKLRQATHAISQEELRPWFPAERVVRGLFATIERLFGMRFDAQQGFSHWHPDVRLYQVSDRDNIVRGYAYLDLYARSGKRGGAWMDDCRVRRRVGNSVQLPVAFITCNFAPAAPGEVAQLTHDEVQTLFHEFGHGIHHLFTQQEVAAVSGINGVEWDAVELPSQFLENWCFEREALDLISGHVETGEALPDALFERMTAARNFQSAMQMLRQIEFALFDFRLHRDYDPQQGGRVQETLDAVREEVAVVRPPAYNRFQHGFSHIFSGGYAAGYYSYKWAEVLSADAFSRFEEEGIFNPQTGQDFLTAILERGGSEAPMQLFVEFRGREPNIDALLRHSGIAA